MTCEDIIQRGTQAAYMVTFADGLEATLTAVTLEWGSLGERLRIPAEAMDGNVFAFDTSAMYGMVIAEAEYEYNGGGLGTVRRIDRQPLCIVKDGQTPAYLVHGSDECEHDVVYERINAIWR